MTMITSCARRVAGEPLLPRLEEILRPAVIQVLDDSLAPAQFGDALLAAQAFNAITTLAEMVDYNMKPKPPRKRRPFSTCIGED